MNTSPEGPTPHVEINRLLHVLHRRVRALLGERFVGMYLYGSLATGGFAPGRSDVDFVVITADLLSDAQFQALGALHRTLHVSGIPWAEKLEGAYIPRAVIRRPDPAHPSVPIWNEGALYLAPLGGDWVIQRRMLRDATVTIEGPPLAPMIDPVSDAAVRAAIREVLAAWWVPMLDDPARLQRPGYQPFAVLSMCRALHALSTGELASKEEAARWARSRLPARWAPLIDHARAWQHGTPIAPIDQTLAFMAMMIERCAPL